MLSEQQQRIMGYFIEEAKDHLNTIEQGLLNLKATIDDPEMVNEVFRAAHSVKGGAAMLGLTSIQHTAHRLEDYFKVLKDCSIQIDQKLETLLLRVYDTLQELLEQLQGPFGLTDDKAEEAMAAVEPVFAELNQHLGQIVSEAGAQPPEDVNLAVNLATTPAVTAQAQPAAKPQAQAPTEESALRFIFQNDVPARLREMLQLFKQADTPDTRRQLQTTCQTLSQLGDQLDLPAWCSLLGTAELAISNPDNTYRTLAPILIKDIKRAQEQILVGRLTEVTASEDLLALLPEEFVAAEEEITDTDLSNLFSIADEGEAADLFAAEAEPTEQAEFVLPDFPDLSTADEVDADLLLNFDPIASEDSNVSNPALDFGLIDQLDEASPTNQPGPEVGMAELNSLADLFEGEEPNLGLVWQEEVIDNEANSISESLDLEAANDFSDLFFQESSADLVLEDTEEDLSGLLNGVQQTPSDQQSEPSLLEFDFGEPDLTSSETEEMALEFGDQTAQPESDDEALFSIDSEPDWVAEVTAEQPELQNLDELFSGVDIEGLDSTNSSEPVDLQGLELTDTSADFLFDNANLEDASAPNFDETELDSANLFDLSPSDLETETVEAIDHSQEPVVDPWTDSANELPEILPEEQPAASLDDLLFDNPSPEAETDAVEAEPFTFGSLSEDSESSDLSWMAAEPESSETDLSDLDLMGLADIDLSGAEAEPVESIESVDLDLNFATDQTDQADSNELNELDVLNLPDLELSADEAENLDFNFEQVVDIGADFDLEEPNNSADVADFGLETGLDHSLDTVNLDTINPEAEPAFSLFDEASALEPAFESDLADDAALDLSLFADADSSAATEETEPSTAFSTESDALGLEGLFGVEDTEAENTELAAAESLDLAEFELPDAFSQTEGIDSSELNFAEPDSGLDDLFAADAEAPSNELETEPIEQDLDDFFAADAEVLDLSSVQLPESLADNSADNLFNESSLDSELFDTQTSETAAFDEANFAVEPNTVVNLPDATVSGFDLNLFADNADDLNLDDLNLAETAPNAELTGLESIFSTDAETSFDFDLATEPPEDSIAEFSMSTESSAANSFDETDENLLDFELSQDNFDSGEPSSPDLDFLNDEAAAPDALVDLNSIPFGGEESGEESLDLDFDLPESPIESELTSLDFTQEPTSDLDLTDLGLEDEPVTANLDDLNLDESTDLSQDLYSESTDLDLGLLDLDLEATSDATDLDLSEPDFTPDVTDQALDLSELNLDSELEAELNLEAEQPTNDFDLGLADLNLDSDAADLNLGLLDLDEGIDQSEPSLADLEGADLESEAAFDFELPEPSSATPEEAISFAEIDQVPDQADADLDFELGFADLTTEAGNESSEAEDHDLNLLASEDNLFGDNLFSESVSEESELDFEADLGFDTLSFDTESIAPDGELDFEPDLAFEAASPEAISIEATVEEPSLEFDDLESMLAEEGVVDIPSVSAEPAEFDDLEAMLADDTPLTAFHDEEPTFTASVETPSEISEPLVETVEAADDFADLEALLDDTPVSSAPIIETSADAEDEFSDLEALLQDADQTLGGGTSPGRKSTTTTNRRPNRRSGLTEQTMRVSVKHLDNLNNLVGEMVVNRNSLEQAQERLRQFLDNLLYQVQQLSDVGQRMRDLYERSLLESSLLSSRRGGYQVPSPLGGFSQAQPNHATGVSFDALEMDRFTGFHTLSQEMIELIVRVRESASDIDFVVEETDQVTRNFRQITSQLQEGLTRSRMVPFAQTADRLPRGVRDNSLKYGKQAELLIEGRDTLIDKMIVEQLYDPMTHLVNNAIAHGIETPEERIAAGKSPTGRITIRAFHQGNQTVISVSDDGAGINPERVKAKALAKGLITPVQAREMSRIETYDLLFHHGFSTADQVDDLRGRGVGLDVVRNNLNEIRGSITTDSTIGKGTTFTIRLPLTLSISKALCCISNRARIAFPMDGVEDMLDVPKERIQIDDQERQCIQWRDSLLPFQPLSDLLGYNRILGRGSVYGGNQEEDMISIVVLRSGGNFLALQVDQVLGEQEIVIKQLEGPVPKPVGVAGATVLGDGRIMPIADVLELIDLWQGRIRRESGSSLWDKGDALPPEPTAKTEPTVLIVDDSITVRELLSMTFSKVGYRVEQARDGQEAWEKLRSGLPCDLVFCDIEMPRMDGLELLSRIQKDTNLSHLPIAMLTSRGADRHRQMAVQLGAKGYFTKPYLEEVLLDAAQRMLKGEIMITSSTQ